MGQSWGSTFTDLGNAGHINAETGLDDWKAGHDILRSLIEMKAN